MAIKQAVWAVAFGSVGIAAASPVVYLPFNSLASLGTDASGNGHNAALFNAPTYDSGGIAGGALDLRGSNDYLRWSGESNPVEDLLDGNFTFSLWIKTTQVFGADSALAFQGAAIIYADVFGVPGPTESDATPLALAGRRLTGLAGNDSLGDLRSTSFVNTGQWVHVAVRRSVGVTTDLFVNGVMESSVPTSAMADLSGADALTLGGNTIDSRYYSGLIDEFQGYEGALSNSQIQFLFSNPGSVLPAPCGPSDVAGPNQSIGADGALTADDIIVFLGWYFASDARADVAGQNQSTTPDNQLTADDIIVFLSRYFAGC